MSDDHTSDPDPSPDCMNGVKMPAAANDNTPPPRAATAHPIQALTPPRLIQTPRNRTTPTPSQI